MERNSYLASKAFKMFLGASILTALSAMLGNIVDGIIVSHLIDYNAMSATSLSKPIIQANYTFYQLIGLGASILVAKALGQNDRQRVNALFSMTIMVLVVYGLTESLIGIFCPNVVVNAICSSPALHDYAMQYFTPLLIGTPLFLAVYFLGGFTAIDGAPKLVSKAMLIDNIVNLCFDIILIKVINLGVMGSSIATLIGHATAIAIISTHYLSGKSQYRFQVAEGFRRFRVSEGCRRVQEVAEGFRRVQEVSDGFRRVQEVAEGNSINHQPSTFNLLKEACSTGLPFAVASICMTIYLYSTQFIIGNGMGKDGLFIFSVMLNIMTIYNMFVTGACQTMQQLAALQLGIGDNYGHRMTVFTAFKFLNISLGTACVILLIAPQLIARMFDCPSELMNECCYAVRIYGFAFWLFCNLYLLMVNYKLLKDTKLANFISFALNLSVIPVMWINVNYLREMVWWSNLVAYLCVFACVCLIASVVLLRNKDLHLSPLFLLPSLKSCGDSSITFSFGYSADDMHHAFDELSAWLRQQNLSDSIVFKVRVIAEELMSNITRHSEQKSKDSCADVRVAVLPDKVIFALTDDGTPFNPIENKDKGYGLMIANGAASEISYKYQFGQNMTTIAVER